MRQLSVPRAAAIILSVWVVAVAAVVSRAEEYHLSFGIYQTDKATVMYQKFTPLLKQLEADLRARTGQPVRIRLRIFKTYDKAINVLVDGKVDFVRFGPASYVIAKQRNADIALLAMEHKNGKKRFQGVVIVAEDSPIKQLSDLRGRRFAFGDKNSTIGRYLVQAELLKAGLRTRDLAAYEYLGRHDKVAKAVLLGDFDAGSLKYNTYNTFNSEGKLRVIHYFDNVTKPWVARAGLDPSVFRDLQASLIALNAPAALKTLKSSGFLSTTDDEYQFVRDAIERSGGFLE
jgi:phosphonate transport system substrate-binding protein